jgi:c-di-GMP-binding flagellar brake protein YcgR
MAPLKSLLTRWRQKPPPRDGGAADRYHQLELLQRRHSFIEVRFPRTDRAYQSLILELHPDEGYVLIDELFPPEGRQELLEGDVAEVGARSPGLTVSFFSRLLLRETVDGAPAYRLELPEEIGASFRRHAFRVYVEREQGLQIDLRNPEGNPYPAHIVNLSADGIKLSIAGNVCAALEKHRLHDNALIRLPDGNDIDCVIDIRNVYPMRTPTLHTLAGGRLSVAQAAQRGKLDHYLAGVQRKQRRRETRIS